jgi:predicted nucleic acid-binding protein
MKDLVIDTNVLLHAQNPNERRCAAARTLLRKLLKSSTKLCIDDGFSIKPANNRSMIGGEYLDKLMHGSIGYAVLVELLRVSRVRQVPRRPGNKEAKKINQLIRTRRDRTFVGVTCNSDERVLVSHDFRDFQISKRRLLRKSLNVHIVEAEECDLE